MANFRSITGTLDATTMAQRVVQARLLTPTDVIIAEVFDPAAGGKVISSFIQIGTFSAAALAAIGVADEFVEFDNTVDLTLADLFPVVSQRVTNHGSLSAPSVAAPPLPILEAGTTFFVWFWDGQAGGGRPVSLNYRVTAYRGSRSLTQS